MKRSLFLSLLFTAVGATLLLGNAGGTCAAGDCAANCIDSCVYGCESQNCSTQSCNVQNCHNHCNFDLTDCVASCMDNCLGWCQSDACYSICENCGAQLCPQCAEVEIGGIDCGTFGQAPQERDLVAGEDYTDLSLTVTDYSTENGRHQVTTSFSVQMLGEFQDVHLILDFKDSNGSIVGTRTLEKGIVNFFDGYTYEVVFGLNTPYESDFYYSVRSFRGTPTR